MSDTCSLVPPFGDPLSLPDCYPLNIEGEALGDLGAVKGEPSRGLLIVGHL